MSFDPVARSLALCGSGVRKLKVRGRSSFRMYGTRVSAVLRSTQFRWLHRELSIVQRYNERDMWYARDSLPLLHARAMPLHPEGGGRREYRIPSIPSHLISSHLERPSNPPPNLFVSPYSARDLPIAHCPCPACQRAPRRPQTPRFQTPFPPSPPARAQNNPPVLSIPRNKMPTHSMFNTHPQPRDTPPPPRD